MLVNIYTIHKIFYSKTAIYLLISADFFITFSIYIISDLIYNCVSIMLIKLKNSGVIQFGYEQNSHMDCKSY